MVRRWFLIVSTSLLVVVGLISLVWQGALWSLAVFGPVIGIGLYHSFQRKHTVLRNFPLIGWARYMMETVRPEIQQYFVEKSTDANPIEREMRALVYQRAKNELETRPFGTQRDVYRIGYEWAAHSIDAIEPPEEEPRIEVGNEQCEKPYSASLLNISAMSFGSISKNAVLALNGGAKDGNFAHNTGEGGVSCYHLEPGGDLIWQIGTGYFGCRTKDGNFDPDQFQETAQEEAIRMIELKISQGAKPSHGGILPGIKVDEEIAEARGLPVGKTVKSPSAHPAFDTPAEMMEFIQKLRELSGGKPVGFKICVGRRTDFFCICKAMLETGIKADFISVDGGEGGTGAAPLEFSNSLGMPARDSWLFVHNALVGTGLRDSVKVIAAGKILSGFHMMRALALGADICASARAMMFALGCIQALRCNTNHCPTGVATTNPALVRGLHVGDKRERVRSFHEDTVRGFLELLGAMGLSDPDDLRPHHIFRRIDDLRIRSFADLYRFFEPGELLEESDLPDQLYTEWKASRADRWVAGTFAESAASDEAGQKLKAGEKHSEEA